MNTLVPPPQYRTNTPESSSGSYSSSSDSSTEDQKPYVVRGANSSSQSLPPPTFASVAQPFRGNSSQAPIIGQHANPIQPTFAASSRIPVSRPQPLEPMPATISPRRIEPVLANGTIPQKVAPPTVTTGFQGYQPSLAPPASQIRPKLQPPSVHAPIKVIKSPMTAATSVPPPSADLMSGSVFSKPRGSVLPPQEPPAYHPPNPVYQSGMYPSGVYSSVHLNAPTPIAQTLDAGNRSFSNVSRGSRRGSGTKNIGDGLHVPTGGAVMRTPEAWVTVPVPDTTGTGVKFRPRGFSFDTTSDGFEPWETKDRYLMAARSGPAECPDHILAKHRDFHGSKSGLAADGGHFASPYTIYYFDETAPNEILLDNDVRRKAVKKAGTSILPKRKSSLREDSDGGSTQDSDRTNAQIHAVIPGEKQTAPVMPETTKPPRGGCCGARRRVSADGASFYGDGSVHTATQSKIDIIQKHDRLRPFRYGSASGDSESSSEIVIRKHDAHPNFSVPNVPATYPQAAPRGISSVSGSATYTSDMGQPTRKQRGCCGGRTDRGVTNSNTYESSSGSSGTSSGTSEYTSSYSSSRSSVSTEKFAGHDRYRTETQSQATLSTTENPPPGCCGRPTKRPPAKPAHDPSLGSYNRVGSYEQHPNDPQEMRAHYNPVGAPAMHGGRAPEGRAYEPRMGDGRRADRMTTNGTDSRSRTYRENSYGTDSRRGGRQRAMSLEPYSDHWEEGLPRVEPSKKKEKEKNLKYTLRKMFFDVEDLRLPENGTGLKMLPAYSTSYKNYPVICYDMVAPEAYQDFFRLRKTPGMYV